MCKTMHKTIDTDYPPEIKDQKFSSGCCPRPRQGGLPPPLWPSRCTQRKGGAITPPLTPPCVLSRGNNITQTQHIDWSFSLKICSPWIDLSNEVLSASNRACMPKLRPRKLVHQFTQTGPIVLALHFLGLGFWLFRVFHSLSTINRP